MVKTFSYASQHPDWLDEARRVLDDEQNGLIALKEALGEEFIHAVEAILALEGRLVVLGMGKSGIIAKKIAATLASTGTPAFFVHAAEALHGDLGMITRSDAVMAISHSGETAEVCGLLPTVKRLGVALIGITGNTKSTLARYADIVLHIPVSQEACPMNLAPTTSTTATLALGDALAVVTLKHRGFKPEDFARVHPAGSLGRKLMQVKELMHKGAELPMVEAGATLREAIVSMSTGRLGITGIVRQGELIGCLSDGDLRRILESGEVDLARPAEEAMHENPRRIPEDSLASEAVRLMEETKITVLFVEDASGRVTGIVHMHDLLQAGIA